MPEVRFIVEAGEAQRAFAGAKAALPVRMGLLARALERIVTDFVRQEAPRRTGEMAQGIRGYVMPAGDVFSVEVRAEGPHAHVVPFILEGTRAHTIVARGHALKFQAGGETLYRPAVRHPGTRANPFVERAVARAMGLLLDTTGYHVRALPLPMS